MNGLHRPRGWDRFRLRTNRVFEYADLPVWWRLMLLMGALLVGIGWGALAASALQGATLLTAGMIITGLAVWFRYWRR